MLALLGTALALACQGGGTGIATSSIGGNPSPTSGGTSAPAPTPPPTSPALPALTGLTSGAVVAGAVTLSASVPANTSQVEFQVDGMAIATATATPFSADWDSFSVANGPHAVAVRSIDANGASMTSDSVQVTVTNRINHVFVIVMENHDWADIKGNASAPYINGTLLAQGAHAENYRNVPGLHPSLPNYIWLESGSNQGIRDDGTPDAHPLATTQHLTSLLNGAGVSWKSYQEDIPGDACPISYVNKYAPRHNPTMYFTDVTDGLNPASSGCIAHVRPYTELARDLETDSAPAYSFITPNICDDMHDSSGCPTSNSVKNGDDWLSREVPKILASRAYRNGGALFITWDESEGGDVPIGFIALSPLAKAGYSNQIPYSHSSTLRSIEEIFAVTPLLGDAANASDLGDLFRSFP